jgi:3-hydroxyacyl-CoA dehydrogenase
MNSRLIATSLRSLKVQNVSVVGSGLMGAGIAQVAAQTGHNVVLNDLNDAALGKAQAGIEKSLGRVAKKMGDEGPKFVEDTMSRMTFTTSIEETAANADLVVEAIVENLGIKQKLFADLEAAASAQCILATNTSSLPVSAIGANLKVCFVICCIHDLNWNSRTPADLGRRKWLALNQISDAKCFSKKKQKNGET